MKPNTQIKLLLILAITSFIGCLTCLAFNLMLLFFILFIGSIGFSNFAGSVREKNFWNGGICEASGEVWEFDSSHVLPDESVTYYFTSGAFFFSTQFTEFDTMRSEYKGKTKIK